MAATRNGSSDGSGAVSAPGAGRRVPAPTVARLPRYHRVLLALEERGQATVSSAELAAASGMNAATLRRDLSHLGSWGTRGTGYEVDHLLARVGRALAIDREWSVVVVGVGNLGRALARSGNFSARGFRVAALLDVDPKVVGTSIGTSVGAIQVEHLDALEEVVAREEAAIAVLATPASPAQALADRLGAAGVRAILNFAPAALRAPPGVRLGTVDLAAELQVLAFYGARTDRERVGTPRRADTTGRRRPAARRTPPASTGTGGRRR
ncbi:MAG: redox-sensing transcriptional repressor [Acidimicrobiaceae bacterium]|nr:redox-sensing transcriptional repressor [Acidimicrobiaceae bacterium]